MTTRNYSSRSQQTTLTSAVTAGASTMVVQSGSALLGGQSIPAGTTFTIVLDPDTAIEEIVDATAVSTNTFTITRGIDGSSGQAHSAGAVARHMAIGRDYRESNAHVEASTGVHGISNSSSVVGTIDTQTLTNKTLTSPTITNPTISGTNVDASIVFEGATPDAFETTLTVVDPTQDNTITMPNTTGTVVIATAVQTLTNKTLTSPTISGSPVITGLSSAGMSASSATPKDYVDSILGSATAAATSAASAATSAASAATSAGSSETSAIASASSATASASSATAAATSATSAAASATAAATSATSAAASATTAANSVATIAGYATASANSATAAATSATSAATSASSALTSANSAATSASTMNASVTAAATSAASAAASATAAATSATSAAASATAANTSAINAAASESVVAASASAAATSATSASNSATAAATSATSASTSASSALTSQTAAATSASSASTSASSALTSATSAATSYDEFDDRYLGAKATPPTVDNDGNALLTGALYWNTSSNKMFVWSGSAWAEISSSADIISYKYTVAGGATSVSGADDNGLTLAYTVGKEQVYINGVLQVRGSDYTATTGSSITGITAMLASDIVTVLAFTAFVVADTYTQAQADAKFYQTAVTSMAGKNVIINGAMEIDQRNTATTAATTTAGVSSTVFGPDRMRLFSNNAGVFSIQQVEDAPAGFRYSCKITTTTADSSVTGADRANLAQFVENVNWNRFAWGTASAKPVTVSFWVKSSLTGTFFFEINVSGGGAAYYTTYTISAANTWEYKTITIPGPTAASNWATNNIDIFFGLVAGPDRQTSTLNSWTTDTTPASGTSSTVNLISTLNATWQITGWQIEQGSVATTFSRAGGTIAGELAACQRYYYRITQATFNRPFGMGQAYLTTAAFAHINFPVTMRIAPTALEQNGTAGDYRWTTAAFGAQNLSAVPAFNTATENASIVTGTVAANLVAGNATNLQSTNAGAYLGWSAEL
jgi:hypothetical protein